MSALPVETSWATLPYCCQGQDGDVESLGFVVAERLRCEETAVLGLRIPVELQAHRSEAVFCLGLLAAASVEECNRDGERGPCDESCR